MIVFLTLAYVAVLAVLVKLRIIKLNLWWKLSPLAWMLFLLVALFIPLQWGAPAGPVNVYRTVVEIVPNVSGEVIEVQAEGSQPLKSGDVLFRIDPEPYQAEVDRLEAALKEAEQNAKMLPVDLASAKAAVTQAQAALVEAQQQAGALETTLTGAQATVAKFQAQLELAQAEFDRKGKLLTSNATSQADVDKAKRSLAAATATLEEAKASRDAAKLALDSQMDGVNTNVVQSQEQLKAAMAAQQRAELALESTINGENTKVAQLRSELTRAKYDVAQTSVAAPSDGFVIGMTLRPGQRVAAIPVRTWMAFVDTEHTKLAVGIDQYALRHVMPGQKAEVALKLYPGRTFAATVEKIAYMTPGGQLQPTGNVAVAPTRSQKPLPYGVVLELNDPSIQVGELPGGATGTAAIYTDAAGATHVMRRVMIRMESYLNYLLPW